MRRIIASMKFSCIQTSSAGFKITKVTISSSTSIKWTSVHVWWTKSNPHEKDELSQDREITRLVFFSQNNVVFLSYIFQEKWIN